MKEVSALRGELEELKRSGPDEAKMKALMEHLADADKGREAVWENAGTHLTLQKTAEDAEKSLAVWKQTMEKLDRESVPREFVAIMERPNAAVEQEPELWRPLILFGLGGFVIGLFLMFLIAGLVAFASKGVGTSPPPLS